MSYKPYTAGVAAFSTTANLGGTTLNGALTDVATTVTVVATADFAASGDFRVDDEVIAYTGVTATTFTGCTRGSDGTTAVSHLTAAAVGERFSSGILDMQDKTQVQTHVLSSQNGKFVVEFYADAGGTDVVRRLDVPYTATGGFQLFAAPCFTPYVDYHFATNDGVTQTDFYYETKFLETAVSAQVLGIDAFIAPNMTASLTRSAIVGEDANGTLNNVTTTETTNDAGTYTNLNVVSGARPSQLSGRVKVTEVIDTSASVLQRTVTASKTFYVTDIMITIENALKTASGRVNFRDGTTIAGAITLPLLAAEAPTSETAVTTIQHSFAEPIEFSTGIYIEENSGTLTITGVIIGYEE
jgi:hypothetical protein